MTNQAISTSRDGEQRYRHLFEHMPICFFVIDLTADPETIIEANRRAEVVYGYPAAELSGMPATCLVIEEANPSIMTVVQQVKVGQRVLAETTGRHRDGTPFPVRVIATPDPADDDLMIIIIEDITYENQHPSEAEAIEAERLRIAHEIHDGVIQNLAGLRFKTALLAHLAATTSPSMVAGLDELLVVLNDAIADLRRAIFALRPVNLEMLGFFPALTQLVTDFGDQNLLAARLEVSGQYDALPVVYELPLFRIIQEGLNNIGQHADANAVLVRLTVDAVDGVMVSVRDDGRSFNPSQLGSADRSGHFGLFQMRERILDLGGTLDIHSTPGQGTELIISLPPITKGIQLAPD